MILTCPSCSTRYLVDPRSLGTTGRAVRCTQCSHMWLQPPAEDAPHRVDVPREEPAPSTAVMLTRVHRAPRRGAMFVPVAVTAIVIAAAAILLLGRDAVMAQWPAATRYYAALGLNAPNGADDLEFRGVTSSRENENGRPALVIKGEVINLSHDQKTVPNLRVTLEDASKRALKTVTVKPSEEQVAPGATVPFQTTLLEPDKDAAGAVVTFDTATGE